MSPLPYCSIKHKLHSWEFTDNSLRAAHILPSSTMNTRQSGGSFQLCPSLISPCSSRLRVFNNSDNSLYCVSGCQSILSAFGFLQNNFILKFLFSPMQGVLSFSVFTIILYGFFKSISHNGRHCLMAALCQVDRISEGLLPSIS